MKQVLQGTDPWMSVEIEKGKTWGPEITSKLGESKFGIVCLTRDNLYSPWINFESGAIAKSADGNVFTFLLDISPGEVEPPLGLFQHTKFERNDVYKLMKDINRILKSAGGTFLSDEDLSEVFAINWTKFKATVQEIVDEDSEEEYDMRPTDEMVEEILIKTRDLDLNLARSLDWIVNRLDELRTQDSGLFSSTNWKAPISLFSGSIGSIDIPKWDEHHWHPKYGHTYGLFELDTSEEE